MNFHHVTEIRRPLIRRKRAERALTTVVATSTCSGVSPPVGHAG